MVLAGYFALLIGARPFLPRKSGARLLYVAYAMLLTGVLAVVIWKKGERIR